MPQWTHFQHAQLSTLGHYFVGIVDALDRDSTRLLAAYTVTNQCTLGCGALAGTSYPVDRELVADLLGFDGVRQNTIDAVAGGDYLLDATAAVANLMVTLSRLCQDLYAWSTEEFGFLTVADEFAGSSSMMPQKRNAYPYEYVRARAAHAIGDATAAFGTLHNTNYQDIKDVEEEMVPPAFRTLHEAIRSLRLLGGTVSTMRVHRERMLERAGAGFAAATELAAVIPRRTPHSARTAHRIVGRMVLLASRAGRSGRQVDLELVNEAARDVLGHELDGLDEDAVRRAIDPREFVEAHDVPGGPARERVCEAIAAADARIASVSAATRAHRTRIEDARRVLDDRCQTRR
jgi:argininosuccinate lyase